MRKHFTLTLGMLVLALASCNVTPPQGDYDVTVKVKTAAHPSFGVGSTLGYVVSGVEGLELSLHIGTSYTFGVNAPGHPFYISTGSIGGLGMPGEVTAGVNNSGTDLGILSFTPDGSSSLLYYQCGVHENMGWKINIVP